MRQHHVCAEEDARRVSLQGSVGRGAREQAAQQAGAAAGGDALDARSRLQTLQQGLQRRKRMASRGQRRAPVRIGHSQVASRRCCTSTDGTITELGAPPSAHLGSGEGGRRGQRRREALKSAGRRLAFCQGRRGGRRRDGAQGRHCRRGGDGLDDGAAGQGTARGAARRAGSWRAVWRRPRRLRNAQRGRRQPAVGPARGRCIAAWAKGQGGTAAGRREFASLAGRQLLAARVGQRDQAGRQVCSISAWRPRLRTVLVGLPQGSGVPAGVGSAEVPRGGACGTGAEQPAAAGAGLAWGPGSGLDRGTLQGGGAA